MTKYYLNFIFFPKWKNNATKTLVVISFVEHIIGISINVWQNKVIIRQL
jgi:hypothetical protein